MDSGPKRIECLFQIAASEEIRRYLRGAEISPADLCNILRSKSGITTIFYSLIEVDFENMTDESSVEYLDLLKFLEIKSKELDTKLKELDLPYRDSPLQTLENLKPQSFCARLELLKEELMLDAKAKESLSGEIDKNMLFDLASVDAKPKSKSKSKSKGKSKSKSKKKRKMRASLSQSLGGSTQENFDFVLDKNKSSAQQYERLREEAKKLVEDQKKLSDRMDTCRREMENLSGEARSQAFMAKSMFKEVSQLQPFLQSPVPNAATSVFLCVAATAAGAATTAAAATATAAAASSATTAVVAAAATTSATTVVAAAATNSVATTTLKNNTQPSRKRTSTQALKEQTSDSECEPSNTDEPAPKRQKITPNVSGAQDSCEVVEPAEENQAKREVKRKRDAQGNSEVSRSVSPLTGSGAPGMFAPEKEVLDDEPAAKRQKDGPHSFSANSSE